MGRRAVSQGTQSLHLRYVRASAKLLSSSLSTATTCSRIGLALTSRVVFPLLIHSLLTPLTLDKLLSHDKDLPRYAEAAPDEFLKLLEEDLRQPQPVVLGLLKPVGERFVRFTDTNRTLVGAGMPRLETPRARQLDTGAVVENRY